MIPADIKNTEIRDEFWSRKQALVRKEVIPYQWEILNDRIPEAEASYCMHNFKAAGLLNEKMRKKGDAFEAPRFTYRGFAVFPEKREDAKEDEFYGFVFQDSDFYKWIEAVGYALMTGPDPVLEETADRAIDIVCAAQLPSGYLDTYYIINGMDKSFSDLRDHHELYCLGHLIEGAISYYQATGKEKLLKTAERYADYVASLFGTEEGKINGYPGHEIAEMALFALYDLTGEERYKNLAEYFINERGKAPNYFEKEHPDMKGKPDYYHQAHIPVREQTEAVGHAVRAVYLYSGMADMARLTGDAALLNACEKLFDSIVNTKMYITGGIGATHLGESFSLPYDLPNDTAYSETCAAIGLVFFSERMLRIKADSKYADVMELALFNTVLSGMALDGKSFFYVNPLDVIPENCKKDERKSHVKPVRQKWFGCACCPPNIARLITSLGRYIYTENENTLYTHLYVGSDTTKAVNGKPVSVSMESGFPNNGNVKIAVNGAKGSGFRLALRIPGWTNGKYRLDVTGASEKEEKDGYIYLGEFSESAAIDISFDMIPRLMAADSRVAEDNLKVAVTRGPIVYCMEGVDNGDKLRQIRIDKNVSFTEEMSGEFGYDVVTLKADAKRIIPSVSAPKPFGELYGEFSSFEEKEISLRLIPYYLWANRGENEMSVYINI